MNSSPRQKWLLIAAAACVGILALDRVVLTPMISSWKSRSDRINQLDKSIGNGAILLDRRDSLQQRWAQIKDEALPADPPTAENQLLIAVNGWAASARFNVTSLKPRWVDDENLGARMEVRVSGTGTLEAAARFLHAIETSELPLRLEDVELRARDEAGRDIGLDARFSGLTSLSTEVKS